MKKIFMFYFSRWGNTNYPADVDVMVFAVSSSPIYQRQERRHEPPKNWQMLRE